MEKWHAAKPKSIANGVPAPAEARARRRPAPPQYTAVFGEAMIAEVRRDRRVVGITAAMNSGTGLNLLQKAEPDHYFDVGIAEQQAVLFAAGLALEGRKPVCAIYSTFLQRAFDQIVHDVCLQRLNVVFAMDRAGLVGDDGPTHHGVFDIAYLRCLPNIVLMAPRDEAMLVAHAAHGADLRRRPDRAALPARRGRRRPAAAGDRADPRSAPARSCARARARSRSSATAPACRRRSRRPTCSPRAGIDVTVADARFAKPLDAGAARPARRRARAARDGRGGRARRAASARPSGRRSRRRPARRRGSCASACPTATSRTASRRCCTPRSASPARRSPPASRPRSARRRARSPAPERWPRSTRSSPRCVDAAALFEAATPEEFRAMRDDYVETAIRLGGALEPVDRVEDVVIARPDGAPRSRPARTGRRRSSPSGRSSGSTAAAGASATSTASTASAARCATRPARRS